MKRPRIGITTDYVNAKPQYMLPWTYPEAVEKAGGLPIVLPYKVSPDLIGDYLDEIDGLILVGGDDLDPTRYGEERHPMAGQVDPDRERFEYALIEEVERRRTPVLGICLGSQLINVRRGGSLHQFLPDLDRDDPLEHRRVGEDWSFRHEVTLDPNSKLAEIFGKTCLSTNSSHKQAINQVGRGLRATAYSQDGVIEATEDPSLPFYVAVQWHPERQNDEGDQLRLFQSLVKAAADWADAKRSR